MFRFKGEGGCGRAQYCLGEFYLDGSLPLNYQTARNYFMKIIVAQQSEPSNHFRVLENGIYQMAVQRIQEINIREGSAVTTPLPTEPIETTCSFCEANFHSERFNQQLLNRTSMCEGCGVAKYCDEDCRMNHWKEGHEQECISKKVQVDPCGVMD